MLSITILLLLGRIGSSLEFVGNETCESLGHVTHFDWDELMSDVTHKPAMNYTLDVDTSLLELVINVDLEYVGDAFADDHTPGYGTTFVLDFEDYDAESDNIRLPGNCQNRFSSDFVGPTFTDLWGYSSTPSFDNHLGNESYLAYPPSGEFWDLSIDPEGAGEICTPIHYEGRFTWNELRSCADYTGLTEYTVISTDENWLNLSGVFYINLVSPLALHSDLGYYRVYQMLSAPFTIALRSQINIISSVGINLFTITIIAVYKEDLETDFRLIVLTESADFLMLEAPILLDSPTLNPDTFNFSVLTEPLNTGCLTASSNICTQIWEIQANDVTCPPTNFTGNYGLQFVTACNPDATYMNTTELCNNYIAEYGSDVNLVAPLNWFDNVCDPEVFIITFDAEMLFMNDSTFNYELGEGDQYQLGDTAYIEINVDTPPASSFDLIEINLQNVWVCTTSPDNEPLGVDASTGLGGCLSEGSIIDVGFPWHIVVNGVDNDLTDGGDVILYEPFANGTVRFSFIIDSSISRVNLYIQAQLTLDLVSNSTGETRRLLLDVESEPVQDTASQTRHFEGATGINPTVREIVDSNDQGEDTDNDVEDVIKRGNKAGEAGMPTEYIYYSLGGVFMIGISALICCGGYYWYNKQKNNSDLDIKNIMKMVGNLPKGGAANQNAQRVTEMSYSGQSMSEASRNSAINVGNTTPMPAQQETGFAITVQQ